jgi:hypothetical protein
MADMRKQNRTFISNFMRSKQINKMIPQKLVWLASDCRNTNKLPVLPVLPVLLVSSLTRPAQALIARGFQEIL